MLIGNSLGMCVLRIARKEVGIEEVLRIDANTKTPNSTDPKHPEWVALLNRYCEVHWRNEADACIAIAEQLIREKKIKFKPHQRNLGKVFWTAATEADMKKFRRV